MPTQPLLDDPFLRAQRAAEFELFEASPASAELLAHAKNIIMFTHSQHYITAFLLVMAFWSATATAEEQKPAAQAIKLGTLFGDHAVLQRELPVPVWGWSMPGTTITVEFAGQKKTSEADEDGKWLLKLDPLPATDKPQEMVISDSANNKVTLKDILIGEVWICSGQSNMQYGWGTQSHPIFNWGGDAKLAALVADAQTKPIRSFTVQPDVALTPSDTCKKSAWSTDVSGSAVAFGFSYYLYQKLNIPVAVIVTCWGSSSLEGWMPRDMTAQLPHFKTIMEEFDASDVLQKRIRATLEKDIRPGNVFIRKQPNLLYNAMLHPLAPYACRGMVWYQGEANADKSVQYAESFPLWAKRLRKEWALDDFHFLVVMLPGFGTPASKTWPWFREAQMGFTKLPHTSVVNTIDLGEENNIHPADKAPVCERLVLLARRDVYGEKIEAQGPVCRNTSVKGNRMVVEFDHADGLKTADGSAALGFSLAGSDMVWLPAKASIKGNAVELEAESLAAPAFIRYAFSGKPAVNLVNGVNLPTHPFRTDDLPQ